MDRPRSVRERRASVPEHVDLAIMKALEKLPADRFATAKEFADALVGRVPIRATGASPRDARRRRGALLAVAIVGIAAAVASAGWWRAAHVPPPVANRFVVTVPPDVSVGGAGFGLKVALSHDGQSLAFAGSDTRVYIRRLDQLEPILFPKALASMIPILTGSPSKIWIGSRR